MIPIVFAIDAFELAGTELQLLRLIKSLDRSHFRISLFVLRQLSEAFRQQVPTDVQIHEFGLTQLLGQKAIQTSATVFKLLRSQRPKIFQAYFQDSARFFLPQTLLSGVPLRYRVRNNRGYWLGTQYPGSDRLTDRCATKILVNSQAASDYWKRWVPRSKLIQLPNLPSFPVRPVWPSLPQFPMQLLCIANLRPVKGIEILLHALGRLKKAYTFQLDIVGDGPIRSELQNLCCDLGLQDCVHFRGQQIDVWPFLERCHLVVAPSLSESSSNSVAEAIRAGRAVLATDVGDNRRQVESAGVGFLIPPGDSNALSQTLLQIMDKPACLWELGKRAWTWSCEQDTLRSPIVEWENFYKLECQKVGLSF